MASTLCVADVCDTGSFFRFASLTEQQVAQYAAQAANQASGLSSDRTRRAALTLRRLRALTTSQSRLCSRRPARTHCVRHRDGGGVQRTHAWPSNPHPDESSTSTTAAGCGQGWCAHFVLCATMHAVYLHKADIINHTFLEVPKGLRAASADAASTWNNVTSKGPSRRTAITSGTATTSAMYWPVPAQLQQ